MRGARGKTPWLCSIEHRCKNAHKQYCVQKLIHKDPLVMYSLEGKKKGRGVITPSTHAAPLNTSQSSIRKGNYTIENK